MKIHSDVLTSMDIYAATRELPGVYVDSCTQHGSRKRARAFNVGLEAGEKTELRRYNRNSGQWGGGGVTGIACTWDEWGIFIAALFDIDPEAIIGQYDGLAAFNLTTTIEQGRVRSHHEETSVYARTHTAPWLGVS